MNKAQKEFLKALAILVWILILMTSSLNAMFDQSLFGQLLPVGLILLSIVVVFIKLGDKKQ